MYQTFKNAICHPRLIVNVLKYRWLRPLIMLMVTLFLATFIYIISLTKTLGLSTDIKQYLNQTISTYRIDYQIIDGVLTSDQDIPVVGIDLYELGYYLVIGNQPEAMINEIISQHDFLASYQIIVFGNTQLEVHRIGMGSKAIMASYNYFELLASSNGNFDFRLLNDRSNLVWSQVFNIIMRVLNDHKLAVYLTNIPIILAFIGGEILLWVFGFSAITKMVGDSKFIKYLELVKLSATCSIWIGIGQFFSLFLGIQFLATIGVIIFAIYYSISVSTCRMIFRKVSMSNFNNNNQK